MNHVSNRFHEALEFSCCLHQDQERKASHTPYISHLLGTASTVLKCNGSEDQAIAALLHDAIEDQSHRVSIEDIRAKFGDVVARIVMACTDEDPELRKKTPWKTRKQKYLSHIKELSIDEMLVVISDKLDNAYDLCRNQHILGDAFWESFNGKREGMLWYQLELAKAFKEWQELHKDEISLPLSQLILEFVNVCHSFSDKKI